MKILHLLDERWDSGITAYAIQIAGLQKDAGHTVVLGLQDRKKPKDLAEAASLPWSSCNNFWEARKLILREAWDIINVHSGQPHSWAVLMGMFYPSLKKIPIVRTRGDARPVPHHPLMRFIYRNTDGVICLSDHIRVQYESFYPHMRELCKTIYPAVHVEIPIAIKDPYRVGMVGRLDPVKGHTVFLEAAARVLSEFPAASFYVAGADANLSVELLKNHTRALGIESRVHFLGFVTDVRKFMAECGVGVIASLGSEEVSRVGLEWMSVGRPIIGTLVGCLPEIIDTEMTGLLIPPEDSVALADAILHLLKNPLISLEMEKNTQKAVRDRFSSGWFLHATMEFYAELIKKRRDGSS